MKFFEARVAIGRHWRSLPAAPSGLPQPLHRCTRRVSHRGGCTPDVVQGARQAAAPPWCCPGHVSGRLEVQTGTHTSSRWHL